MIATSLVISNHTITITHKLLLRLKKPKYMQVRYVRIFVQSIPFKSYRILKCVLQNRITLACMHTDWVARFQRFSFPATRHVFLLQKSTSFFSRTCLSNISLRNPLFFHPVHFYFSLYLSNQPAVQTRCIQLMHLVCHPTAAICRVPYSEDPNKITWRT